MLLKLLFLLLNITLWVNISGAQELEHADINTLRLVHAVRLIFVKISVEPFFLQIWRHGDRTPSILLPTDPANGINSWPLGLGELTKRGIQQEFKLGQFLRKRYDGFLSQDYSPFEVFFIDDSIVLDYALVQVYVRSSDYNRTLASGQAVLSGIFPIHGEELWVPIPVHTVPKPLDTVSFLSSMRLLAICLFSYFMIEFCAQLRMLNGK